MSGDRCAAAGEAGGGGDRYSRLFWMWGCKSLKYEYGGSDRLGWVMLYLLAGVPGAGVAYGVQQVKQVWAPVLAGY